jgi:hypothetical protein
MSDPLRALIEAGSKRTFACALDWTGLARSGKTEAAAVEALITALPRYAVVAREAGVPFDDAVTGTDVQIVERVTGGASTDFGVPGNVGAGDRVPLTVGEARREAALVAAAWAVFDRIVAAAPAELRKGPRGGGRDRDKIVGHVQDAERAYAGVMGIPGGSTRPMLELRAAMLEEIGRASDGSPLAGKRWPPRYAARRIAWHVLDHAWEIEDRSE